MSLGVPLEKFFGLCEEIFDGFCQFVNTPEKAIYYKSASSQSITLRHNIHAIYHVCVRVIEQPILLPVFLEVGRECGDCMTMCCLK